MALQTKAITANGANGHHKFTLTVTENSTSKESNSSSVSWALVIAPIVKGYDWISNSGKVKYSVTVNGTAYSGIIATYDGTSTVTIKSATQTCPHNEDGSKTISFSFSITDSSGWSFAPGNVSKSGTMALTDIERYATIVMASNFTDVQNPTIHYKNPKGSGVESLDLCLTLDGTTVNALEYRPVDLDGTIYTYVLSAEDREYLRNATPNSNTLQVGFYLRSIVGGVMYFSKVWRTMTIVNADPILEPVIVDTNTDLAGVTGGTSLIRSYSNVYFETGARAQKGATIKSQTVTLGGVTLEGAAGIVNGVQSGDFVFTAVDSRGNTTTVPISMPFIEYTAPSCSIISGEKPDGDGNFTLRATGVVYQGNIAESVPNVAQVYYYHKVSGENYGSAQPMTVTVKDGIYTAVARITGLDYRKTHVFKCVVIDHVTSATSDEEAVKSVPVFDWGEEDFNFNVPVNAPAISVGGVEMDYIVEQGTKDGWIYRKWNSGIGECWKNVTLSTAVSTTWGSMYTGSKTTRQSYPFVFIEKPVEQACLTASSSSVWLFPDNSGNGVNGTHASAQYGVARPSAVSTVGEYYISLSVIGRWK